MSLKSHGDRPRPFGCSRKGSFDPVAGVPGAGSEGLPRGEAHEAAHLAAWAVSKVGNSSSRSAPGWGWFGFPVLQGKGKVMGSLRLCRLSTGPL